MSDGCLTAANIKNFKIKDKTHLYEIAKLCTTQGFPDQITTHIEDFGIEDKTHLLEIAKLCALQHNSEIAANIKNFGIEDKTELFEIAKICAQHNSERTSKNIKNFGIEDKTQLFEIAKFCAKNCGSSTAKNIKNFGIEDKRQLYKVAKLCKIYSAPENIKNFGIKDKTHLYKLAKIYAKDSSRETAKYIHKFKIENKDHLFEIAKLCAMQNGGETAFYIKNFGIENKQQLYKIAKLCAKQTGSRTALYIRNFGIEDKNQLFKIAKLCAMQNGLYSGNIERFEIEDKNQLYEIAQLCAKHKDGKTALYIKSFKIEDKKQLYKIAKLSANQDAHLTAKYIKNFGIEDKEQLYKIAMLCVEKNCNETAENIKNFELADQTKLFEIAKFCAQKDPYATTLYINNFRIKDKAKLAEIAKDCAQKDNNGTAAHIKNFRINDKTQLYEIAKLCARQNGDATANNIKNFGIEDQTQLIEIARICVQKDNNGTAKYIKNFGIEDKTQIYEIAKLCVLQGTYSTIHYFQNFGINDRTQIFEIAWLCAQKDAVGTARSIGKFMIDDAQMRWELFLECFKVDNDVLKLIQNFLPSPEAIGKLPQLFAELIHIQNNFTEEMTSTKLFFQGVNRLIEEISCSEESVVKLVKMCDEIENSEIHIQKEAAPWILRVLFLCTQVTTENRNWILESELLFKLSKLHEPRLKLLLTPGLFNLNKRELPKGTHGLPLLVIPFFQLEQQEVSLNKLMQLAEFLKQQGQNKTNILKNSVIVQTILHAFHLLASADFLSSKELIQGVDKIIYNSDKTIVNNLRTLLDRITAVRGLLLMENSEWANSDQDPIAEFCRSFERLINLKGFEGDFFNHYEKIFGKSRNPYGLILYAASLNTLNEPKVMDCLGRYISSVFNNTFQETRYEISNNPHLEAISQSHRDVLELWKKNREKPLEEILIKEEKQELFNPREWIRTKLITDKHLGDTKLPFIESYFDANTREGKELITERLTSELKMAPIKILKLQQACIAFAEANPDHLTPLLKEIQAYLDPLTEFANDVKGMLAPKKTYLNLKVVFTDDPIDLLLCGSDVNSSCQRLEGDPSLNKGLLGYLMDGKNRLLAIKDEKGKIVSRCILRLLWDGERPVLFRERMYSNDDDSRYLSAMNQIAKELAKDLNIPLTSLDEGTRYGKPLHALGGPAPYEYCDSAARGMQNDGRYIIDNANTIEEQEI